MKLASFMAEGRDRIGFSLDETVLYDFAEAGKSRGHDLPGTMLELIEAGAPALQAIREIAHAVSKNPSQFKRYDIKAVTWRPPVRRPSKLCCIALNNSANPQRIMKGPKHPAIFLKPASALVGHEQAIECRLDYGRVHPEPELAVIIGKEARNVDALDSLNHVFGYTIFNDITSPTMREEDTFHYRAIHPKGGDAGQIEYVESWVSYSGRYKGTDTFACLGPWIAMKDDIPDPHALDVQCHHQGRLITEDNTLNLLYSVAEVISFASRYMTLLPGDIIAMGTALKQSASGGAIQNIDLNKLGGPVSVTISGIGTLVNSVTHIDR